MASWIYRTLWLKRKFQGNNHLFSLQFFLNGTEYNQMSIYLLLSCSCLLLLSTSTILRCIVVNDYTGGSKTRRTHATFTCTRHKQTPFKIITSRSRTTTALTVLLLPQNGATSTRYLHDVLGMDEVSSGIKCKLYIQQLVLLFFL